MLEKLDSSLRKFSKQCTRCGAYGHPKTDFYLNRDRGVVRIKNQCKLCSRRARTAARRKKAS